MPSRLIAAACLASAGTAIPAAAGETTPAAQAVEIADAAVREPKTEVLVLGTPHLSALPEGTDPALFEPVLDRLAAWKPELIAIEAIDGAQCDYLRAFAFAYEGTAETYCFDAAPARRALGLDQAGAEKAIAELLAEPRSERPPAERRRLAALFLAAGDRTSAMVQWLRLPEAERRPDAVLTEERGSARTTQAPDRKRRDCRQACCAARARTRPSGRRSHRRSRNRPEYRGFCGGTAAHLGQPVGERLPPARRRVDRPAG
jgi:hypothetical protein